MTPLDPIYVSCLGFAGLFLLLTFLMVTVRSGLVLSGNRSANSFGVDGAAASPFLNRLTRARNNYYENLGALALIVLVASSLDQIALLNGLAYVFLAARMAQTLFHLLSTANAVVVVRAVCFILQITIQIYWLVLLWGVGGGGGCRLGGLPVNGQFSENGGAACPGVLSRGSVRNTTRGSRRPSCSSRSP